ncbi:MAG: hypothetical protein JNK15_19650 [Planctomycetes bacterium]|nr:hypothetical protein [Planctomycetota bacterium]
MPRPTRTPFPLLAMLAALPLPAQGNELVFVGTSVGGSNDPGFLVAADTGAVVATFPGLFADNVRGAVWADAGRNLYVARNQGSPLGALPAGVTRFEWNGATSIVSTLHTTNGTCYGVDLDATRRQLWVLAGATPTTRELRCLDVDPASATYGAVLAQTNVLGGTVREHFRLSASGNYAVVARAFLSVAGCLDVIDLDPTHATYLQNVAPIVAGGGNGVGCAITPDDQYALLLCTSPAALVVVHVPTLTALDFAPQTPGQQNFAIPFGSAVGMAMANDGSFVVACGIGSGGWAGRIDLDYATPGNSTFTALAPGQVPNCRGASVSPDDTRIALTSEGATGSELLVLDAATGAVQHRTALPGAASALVTAWQRDPQFATYSPFGSGCAGSLGVPVLDAAAGTKPVLGTTFTVQVDNLPLGLGLVGFGAATTTFGSLPLPFDLGLVGMPGCTLFAAPEVTLVGNGVGTTATVTWPIPATPTFAGFRFHNQAFALDPTANMLGFVTSNAAAGQLGW